MTARRGGCDIKKNFAKPPKQTQPGWFSLLFSIGKPPRPREQRMLRDIFLLARPPLLAVMQGGEYRSPETHSRFVRAPTVAIPSFATPSVRRGICSPFVSLIPDL